MRFLKVEGAGNDYVLVDGFRESCEAPERLARAVSRRHTGVGADGLLLVLPPPRGSAAAAEMRMFNADGSEGRMCGNGLRCVVRWLVRQGRAGAADEVLVETASGPRRGRVLSDRGDGRVEVSMGRPRFAPEEVPARVDGDGSAPPRVALPAALELGVDAGHAVSVGNPHLVLRVDDPEAVDLAACGPTLERLDVFPDGVNVHVVAADGDVLRARTWERGSGVTRACGTGAVAAAAVARALDWCADDALAVEMPGGRLAVRFDATGEAWLEGPARFVFQGDWLEA